MPQDEETRIRRLRALGVLDTPPEQRFDRITRMAADIFKAPIALVSLVDVERQWFKSRVGLEAPETPRSLAFCAHAIEDGPNSVMVVENAAADPRFAGNPLVVDDPNIRFYAGATLTTSDGNNLGTLCVIDRTPRPRPSDHDLDRLRDLAAIVVDEMELSRKIKQADERLALLQLSEAMSGVGFWRFDVPTSQVMWSDQVYAIYGVEPKTFDPNLQSVVESYHPDDRPILQGYIERALTTGEGYSFELRIRRSDGDYRRVAAKAIAEADSKGQTVALIGVLQDVTDYVRAREAIAESEMRYRMIADNTTDVIGRISLEGVIRYVSPAIQRLAGYSVEDMEGTKTFSITHPEDIGTVVAAFRHLMAGRTPDKAIRYRIRHKNTGEWIWVEANPRVVVGPSGEPEFIDVLRDIRGQVALEASMLRARSEAEAGARAKADFLANMSHEIRTPLNGIVGYAALLASSPDLPPKHRRHADVISSSSKGLIRIVDDVLDFSALDSGEVGFEMRPLDIRNLLRTTVETLHVQAAARKLQLHARYDARLANSYLGDDARIRQVLFNLIGNAIKFTNAGSIDIDCETVRNGSRQTVRCTVRDTGIGISTDKIGNLFSRFSQADSSISRRYGGTGLGLAISQKIIRAMGGEIGVESVEGAGSTFWFTLPLAATDVASGLTMSTTPTDAAPPVQHRRILVVDDHDINRELAAVLLSPMGHEVVLASDGEQALQFVEREAFDLIFMDIQMPGMDGFAATRAIRAMEVGKSTPIVALTAHAMRQQVDECIRAGMDGHVAKPFSVETLQHAVAKWATPDDSESLSTQGAAGVSPEMQEFRRRFVARAAEDAAEIEQFIANPSAATEARAKSVVHKLAGTAGSLGFHDAGQIALAIDASVTAGDHLRADDLRELLSSLQKLQPAV